MESYIKFSLHADQLILLVILGLILPLAEPNTDYTSLVYKKCANETFTDQLAAGSSHEQTLASLFNELVLHSSQSKFFRATAGEDHGRISGIYQCRRDIANQDCHGCVTKLHYISNALCNRAVAAKIQLSGCSLHYKADSFSQEKDCLPFRGIKYEEEHKVCSKESVEVEGFDELRDSAFEELESEVKINHGFSIVEREGFQAVAQCEEDMEEHECGKCISHAVEIAKEECESALSGDVFLVHCSVRYVYEGGEGEGNGGGEGEGEGEGEGGRGEGEHSIGGEGEGEGEHHGGGEGEHHGGGEGEHHGGGEGEGEGDEGEGSIGEGEGGGGEGEGTEEGEGGEGEGSRFRYQSVLACCFFMLNILIIRC